MDNLIEASKDGRIHEIKNSMARIERRTSEEKVIHKLATPEEKADWAANAVIDGLVMTLGVIGRDVGKIAQDARNTIKAREYDLALAAIDNLTAVVDGISESKIQFRQNKRHEEARLEAGDSVRSYIANNVVIDGKKYSQVEVTIRPEKWNRKLLPNEDNTRYSRIEVEEIREPRMKIMIHDAAGSKVEIRADRGSYENDYQIMYDLVVGDNREQNNVFDMLELNDPQLVQMRHEGHHFKSALKETDFQTTFPEIMRSMITHMDTLVV